MVISEYNNFIFKISPSSGDDVPKFLYSVEEDLVDVHVWLDEFGADLPLDLLGGDVEAEGVDLLLPLYYGVGGCV